jgi:hypothetical protein
LTKSEILPTGPVPSPERDRDLHQGHDSGQNDTYMFIDSPHKPMRRISKKRKLARVRPMAMLIHRDVVSVRSERPDNAD